MEALGDAIPMTDADGEPVLVEDDRGTYQRITLDPASAAASKVTASVDPSVEQAGITNAEVLEAQQFLSRFIVEEASDSTALDNGGGGYARWVAENEDEYIASEFQDFIRNDGEKPALLTTPSGGELDLTYLREGRPREANVSITYTRINNVDQNGDHNLIFTGSYDNEYLASSKVVLAAYEAKGYTRENVFQGLPKLRDGAGITTISGTMRFEYAVAKKPEGWRITGYHNSFSNDIVK